MSKQTLADDTQTACTTRQTNYYQSVHQLARHIHERGLQSFGGSSRNPDDERNGDAEVLESNIRKTTNVYHIHIKSSNITPYYTMSMST